VKDAKSHRTCLKQYIYIYTYLLQRGVYFSTLLDVLHVLAHAKNILWACPCLSVCRVFPTGVDNLHDRGSLLLNGNHLSHCWKILLRNNEKRGKCWNTLCNNDLVSQWKYNLWAKMTWDHISVTITYVMWREAYLWNVSILQKVHISSFVLIAIATHFCDKNTSNFHRHIDSLLTNAWRMHRPTLRSSARPWFLHPLISANLEWSIYHYMHR
jgi:hypothetical protein